MENSKNRQLKIDLFLKQIQLLSQTNQINSKQIYAQLASYGISESEKLKDLSEVFDSLQETNQYNSKMDVFVDPNWHYFCQFKPKNFRHPYNINPIKIYIPLKKQNIEKYVQRIFAFINQNDIRHCSKLAKQIRTDSLVVRVYDQKSADMIVNFVNMDEELTDNMYEANPFCVNEGKVGLAMDRILSYNSILSKYIYAYINESNRQNQIVSYNGFKLFLQIIISELESKADLSEYIKMNDENYLNRLPEFLQSLEEITKIIIQVINGESKEWLYKYNEEINRPLYNQEKSKEYEKFDYMTMLRRNNSLLKEFILTTTQKYGYINTIQRLISYKNSGNINCVTKTNNLKEKVASSQTFRTYLNIIDLDIELKRMAALKSVEEKTIKEYILEDICRLTYISCQTPERKYSGKIQVELMLGRMQMGDYDCITRLNDARMIAFANIQPEEIKELLKKTLETKGYIIEKEEDLYEQYANHIEYLCNNNAREGEINVKK